LLISRRKAQASTDAKSLGKEFSSDLKRLSVLVAKLLAAAPPKFPDKSRKQRQSVKRQPHWSELRRQLYWPKATADHKEHKSWIGDSGLKKTFHRIRLTTSITNR
jgi:hypothetical protein